MSTVRLSWPEGRAAADFDALLPGMAVALDPTAAAQRFERQWPGRGESPTITACTLEYVHWSPGIECVATYRLSVSPSLAAAPSTLGVIAVHPEGIEHRLLLSDTNLPGLVAATDPGVMSRWLAERLGRSVHISTITPVRYRPGRRCVLRYELSGDPIAVLYGKLLAGTQTRDLTPILAALGESLAPPLIGAAHEWQLFVQADVGGRKLSSALASVPTAADLMDFRAGGRLLASLHSRQDPPGDHRSLVEDADELRQYLPAVHRASPAVAEILADGIERVRAVAGDGVVAGPSHGAFRLDQVHLGPAGAVLIDLDSFCWADPARDLGNLLAYQRWREIRRPAAGPGLTEARAAFLAGYHSEAPSPIDDTRTRAYEAASLLKVAGRRYPRLKFEQWPLVPQLIDAALERLGTGVGGRA